jgi:hypothetical protein
MMRLLFSLFSGLAALAAGSGCAPFTRAERELVSQAQRGIALIAEHDQERARAVAALATIQRQRLDEAFDEDVQLRAAQETLDPDWVIEARKAYALGLEAFARSQAAAERSAETRRQNLAAVGAALDRLMWMQSVRLKLDLLKDPEARP